MTKCLIGSQKQVSAPATFKVNAGAICFLLNIDSPICDLLDKIPSLVGEGWREIIKEVAGSAFSFVNSEDVDTAVFCSVNPPSLPAEITYIEVFQLIASYVPPLSLVASSSPILKKISDYYLFTKWQEFCECKPDEEEEKEDDEDEEGFQQQKPMARIELDNSPDACPPNSARTAANTRIASLEAIGIAAKAEAAEANDIARNLVTSQTFEERIQEFIENYTGDIPIEPQYQVVEIDGVPPQPMEENISRAGGCITVSFKQIFGFQFTIKGFEVELFDLNGTSINTLSSNRIYIQPVRFLLTDVDIRDCGCEEEELPKVPKDESGGDCDCIPIAPERFCELFPDDPLCANVPKKPPIAEEPTAIEVASYENCEPSMKTVFWRIE